MKVNITQVTEFVTIIQDAIRRKNFVITIPETETITRIAELMYKTLWLADLEIITAANKKDYLRITIQSKENLGLVLDKIKQISKPGRRYYEKGKYRRIYRVINKRNSFHATAIVSTNSGITLVSEDKSSFKHGGEVLLILYCLKYKDISPRRRVKLDSGWS